MFRPAEPADLQPILRLVSEGLGVHELGRARVSLERSFVPEIDTGTDPDRTPVCRWLVATPGPRHGAPILAVSARRRHRFTCGARMLSGAHVELLVTAPTHRGEGLATAAVIRHCEESATDGDEFQFVDGTSGLFARAGFDIEVAEPIVVPIDHRRPAADPMGLRPARAADAPLLAGLPPRKPDATDPLHLAPTSALWEDWIAATAATPALTDLVLIDDGPSQPPDRWPPGWVRVHVDTDADLIVLQPSRAFSISHASLLLDTTLAFLRAAGHGGPTTAVLAGGIAGSPWGEFLMTLDGRSRLPGTTLARRSPAATISAQTLRDRRSELHIDL